MEFSPHDRKGWLGEGESNCQSNCLVGKGSPIKKLFTSSSKSRLSDSASDNASKD